MSIGDHLDHRIYVWAKTPADARKRALAILGKRGHTAPFPELRAYHTGLTRPGSYEVGPGIGYGDYTEQVGDTIRRFAVDPVI